MKTLIAEESLVSRSLLEVALRNWGYEIVIANDGNQAWDILQSGDAPNMAILDWVMPGMSGPEICRALREWNPNPYIYVLLLTGKRHREDIVNGLDSGADDYLTKPYDLNELRARLQVGKRIIELQQMLMKMATHDSLTQLQNHGAILDSLEREIERSIRKQTPLSVILADMDFFKRINDTHGHLAGDAVLQEIAERIRSSTRPYDRVGRYGGEEFLMVLPDCNIAKAVKQGERIRQVIERRPLYYQSQPIPLTVSIGVSSFDPHRPLDVAQLIRKADQALYLAKSKGRNRVEVAA